MEQIEVQLVQTGMCSVSLFAKQRESSESSEAPRCLEVGSAECVYVLHLTSGK